MITCKNVSGGHVFYCLSTDKEALKANLTNGDVVVEMDTSKAYFWDAEHERYIQTTLSIAL